MRRLLVLVSLPLLLTACGGTDSPVAVPPPAPPQEAELGWVERTGDASGGVSFRVERFDVTSEGWSAAVSVSNDTPATFTVGEPGEPLSHAFGLMVFRTGTQDELQRRNLERDLPGLRAASSFAPALPESLGPGATWSGTMSAPGALPGGLWIRFVFGAFLPADAMPDALREQGVTDELTWITDHAYRLRG